MPTLKLLVLKEKLADLETGTDFSSSMALDVLRSLAKMKIKHFMVLSASLFGDHFWVFSSSDWIGLGADLGGRSRGTSTLLSL